MLAYGKLWDTLVNQFNPFICLDHANVTNNKDIIERPCIRNYITYDSPISWE